VESFQRIYETQSEEGAFFTKNAMVIISSGSCWGSENLGIPKEKGTSVRESELRGRGGKKSGS